MIITTPKAHEVDSALASGTTHGHNGPNRSYNTLCSWVSGVCRDAPSTGGMLSLQQSNLQSASINCQFKVYKSQVHEKGMQKRNYHSITRTYTHTEEAGSSSARGFHLPNTLPSIDAHKWISPVWCLNVSFIQSQCPTHRRSMTSEKCSKKWQC